MHSYRFFGCILAVTEQAFAQACSSATVSSSVPAPSVAPGYGAQLVATGLTKPRGITFDQQGHLLVVEQNSGVTALTLDDAGGACVSEKSRQTVVNDTSVSICRFFNNICLADRGVLSSIMASRCPSMGKHCTLRLLKLYTAIRTMSRTLPPP